jgi:hypothetical protein
MIVRKYESGNIYTDYNNGSTSHLVVLKKVYTPPLEQCSCLRCDTIRAYLPATTWTRIGTLTTEIGEVPVGGGE